MLVTARDRQLFKRLPKATLVYDSILGVEESTPDAETFIQGFYDVMNKGKVMWPGRTRASALLEGTGAKLTFTSTEFDLACSLVPEETINSGYLNGVASRARYFKKWGSIYHLNVAKGPQA